MTLLVDDRSLLEAFRAGQAAALARVFRHYAPGVAALLRGGFSFQSGAQQVRFQGHDQIFDLEDALQEVFRRAFAPAARQTYDGLRPFRAYLGAIARNTVINQFQERQRSLDRFRELAAEPAADAWSPAHDPLSDGGTPTGQPVQDVEAGELRALVAAFKQSLKERERLVFSRRFEEGESHKDIAAATGLSEARIKTSEARIRRRLLRFLRGHGYLEDTTAQPLAVVLRPASGDEP